MSRFLSVVRNAKVTLRLTAVGIRDLKEILKSVPHERASRKPLNRDLPEME